jgi:hypothetical protein
LLVFPAQKVRTDGITDGRTPYGFSIVDCPNAAKVRDEFLKTLSERIEAISNLIIGGDFNSVEDLKLDKTGQSANYKKYLQVLFGTT